MPDFSAAARGTSAIVSIQFRDFRGVSHSTSIRNADPAVSAGEVDAFRVAVGNASNARVMKESVTVVDGIINAADPLNTVFDEAYSTVGDQLVLAFQNATGSTQTVTVPAPDLSMFLPDGETIDPENGLFTAVRDAALAVMPAGYVYARSWLVGTGRRARTPLPVAEPLSTDSPPQLPASEPVE